MAGLALRGFEKVYPAGGVRLRSQGSQLVP